MRKMCRTTRLPLALACFGMLMPPGTLWAASPEAPAKPPAASVSQAVQDVALSADRSLSGVVLDMQGQPRAGSLVLVDGNAAGPQRAVTDSQGRFTIANLRGGVYRITTPRGAVICRIWSPGTAPPTARSGALIIEMSDVVRGQFYGPAGQFIANPWVLAGVLTAAVTVAAIAADTDSGS